LSLKANILLKRFVIISLVGFSIIISGGISLIFKSSIQRDTEHIRFVELTGKVERQILKARIYIDDLILNNEHALLPEFKLSLDSVQLNLEDLHRLISIEHEDNHNIDFNSFTEHYSDISQDLLTIKSRLNASDEITVSDTTLFSTFSQLHNNYKILQSFLPSYLMLDTLSYKREIVAVLVVNFIIILLAGFIILKLINQLIRADRTMVHKTIEVEKRERERIAADLHDGLGALLSGLIIHIQVMEKENKEQPEILSKLKHLNFMSNQALQSIEEVINNLNPSILARNGLIKSLIQITDKINTLGKTQFSVHGEKLTIDLPTSTELLLYRIATELINNALKHSGADYAEFYFHNQRREVHLVYKDDGVGFDLAFTSFEEEKSGLYNLIRRVESMEGKYVINSQPGRGVEIRIIVNAD
jgi:signal transduction histidine kinase